MIEITPEELSIIQKIYIVANTPSYLYKHFRRDAGVERLANIYDVVELVEHIVQVDNKKERTLADVASAYAACVALTFHDAKPVIGKINSLKLRNLEWVKSIINIWEKSYIPTQVTDALYTHKPEIVFDQKIGKDVSTQNTDISYKHEPKVGEKDLFQSDSSLTDIINEEENHD